MKTLIEKEIKQYLSKKLAGKTLFTTSELKALLRKVNPDVSNSAHAWWINKLKNDNFYIQVGRGIYTFQEKEDYKLEISQKAKQFYNKVIKYLPEGTPFVIYESITVAKMYGLEPNKHYIWIHVPREHIEFFFYDIQHLGKRIFIKPNKEIITRYIIPFKEAVILYPLLTEMPTIDLNGYKTLTLEGILIHSMIFGEEYFRSRDSDIKKVFQMFFKKYYINISKLLRYAARRDKRKQVKELLEQIEII
ncbi:MAG: hypothetical protein PF485_13785 [Bacteroidales bacterium]|jgi:hypothetical protein|nr:hypothetical protein [Bacteroidales bacterium]